MLLKLPVYTYSEKELSFFIVSTHHVLYAYHNKNGAESQTILVKTALDSPFCQNMGQKREN